MCSFDVPLLCRVRGLGARWGARARWDSKALHFGLTTRCACCDVAAWPGSQAALFQACQVVCRSDIQVSLFLMPYVVHNVVAGGSPEARAGVCAEVEAVLRGGASSREGELCVQAVFTLLDVLKAWLEEQRNAAVPTGCPAHLAQDVTVTPATVTLL
jgi:hypothetical protein